jgi:hypothetical protein
MDVKGMLTFSAIAKCITNESGSTAIPVALTHSAEHWVRAVTKTVISALPLVGEHI